MQKCQYLTVISYYNLKIIIFFICIYVYFILKLLLSERFAVALLLAVPIDLKKSLQTTNVYILLCNFFLCQRSNKYYLSIYLSHDKFKYSRSTIYFGITNIGYNRYSPAV